MYVHNEINSLEELIKRSERMKPNSIVPNRIIRTIPKRLRHKVTFGSDVYVLWLKGSPIIWCLGGKHLISIKGFGKAPGKLSFAPYSNPIFGGDSSASFYCPNEDDYLSLLSAINETIRNIGFSGKPTVVKIRDYKLVS